MTVVVRSLEVWREALPALLWAIVDVTAHGDSTSYQVVLGVRDVEDRPNFLDGKDDRLLGTVDVPDGEVLVYDALIDPELAMAFFDHVAPSLGGVHGVRPLTVEQSNTSIVVGRAVDLQGVPAPPGRRQP